MQRIFYIAKKAQQKLSQTFSAESSQFIQIKNHLDVANLKTVGFYLDNPLFVHLGDQLFFEPVLRLLSMKYEVYIKPTNAMAEYFAYSRAKLITDERIFDCDVIITRGELLSELMIKTKKPIICVNTLSKSMHKRIVDELICNFSKLFNVIIPDNFIASPWKPIANNIKAKANKVILAPYIDSGWFRVFESDIKQLSFYAKNNAEQSGLALCVIGGISDISSKLPSIIGDSFEDWRGRYSPCEFLNILSSGIVDKVFTFDTFVAHAAVICGVPVTVKIRRALPPKTMFIKKHFLPAYSDANSKIEFL